MRRWIEAVKYTLGIGAVIAFFSCADAPTDPVEQRILTPGGLPSLNVVQVGGRDYYQDESSSELVPTAEWDASIVNMASYASIACGGDDSCQGDFKSVHQGMWHWTTQYMDFEITGANTGTLIHNGEVLKTSGTGCVEWLFVFCAKKKQENEHTARVKVAECRAATKLDTMHEAGWGILATWSVGGWTLSTPRYGETSQSTNITAVDESRCGLCDNPSTPDVETCDVSEREEPAAESPGGGGGGGDCPTCLDQPPSDGITTCWVRRWFDKMTGEVFQVHILYCY